MGVAKDLGALPKAMRRAMLAGLFLRSALINVPVAEPFAKSLISGAKVLGLDEFLRGQWVAPLATEGPEFFVADILALRGDQDTALRTLLSNKVNQWTLLVGSLPIAYRAFGGHQSLPLDARQVEEFWLTPGGSDDVRLRHALRTYPQALGSPGSIPALLPAVPMPPKGDSHR
ncbi:hypothetical protein [Mesoterricola silvestris]|uniref:hypothetical protein n=1 Tax=Mesoterricola silvestris TaxID=2927979 RepID=UPI002930B207|nr:hypothetical protein [Mesoterricola silvestris]